MKLSRFATVTAACAVLALSACSSSSVSAPTQAPSLVSASNEASASSTSATPAETPSSTSSSESPSAESPTSSEAPVTDTPAPAEDLAVIGESCGLLYGKDYLEATLVAGSITCSDMIAIFEQDMAENSMEVRLSEHPVGAFTCRTNDWDTSLQLGWGTECKSADSTTVIRSVLNDNASRVGAPGSSSNNDQSFVAVNSKQYVVAGSEVGPYTYGFNIGHLGCFITADGDAFCRARYARTIEWFGSEGYGSYLPHPQYLETMDHPPAELPQGHSLSAHGVTCTRDTDDTVSCVDANGTSFSYGPDAYN